MTTARGFTLIELIVSIAVLTILISLAAPAFDRFVTSSRASGAINWLNGLVQMTRLAAVSHQAMVTLCPTSSKTGCGGNWNGTLMMFVDHNADRSLNGNDFMVDLLTFPYADSSIKWRSFGNQQHLQITPQGYTNFQGGNFTWCPASLDASYARQLIISMQGRTRMARDRNGDGLVEDSQGSPVRC